MVTVRPSANGHRPELPHRPADWDALGYRPAEGTPLLRCARCGGSWLDDEPGRAAHIAVFGHSPRTRQPAESAEGESP